jgi:hypothetical protein
MVCTINSTYYEYSWLILLLTAAGPAPTEQSLLMEGKRKRGHDSGLTRYVALKLQYRPAGSPFHFC